MWRIHKARKKGPNKKPVSVFIFDKKKCSQKVVDYFKKDADELARIKHPNIITLEQQPLEDKALVFITEPVEYSLAFLLDNYKMKNSLPGELEVKLIMLELMEAVHFLHNTAKIAHLNISPENIYLTKDGKVKLTGFSCSSDINETTNSVNFNFKTY